MGYVESTNTWREQTNKITTWILLYHQEHHFKSNRNFQRRKSRATPKDPDTERYLKRGRTKLPLACSTTSNGHAGAVSIKTQVSPLYSMQGCLLQAHISYRWNSAPPAPLKYAKAVKVLTQEIHNQSTWWPTIMVSCLHFNFSSNVTFLLLSSVKVECGRL